MARDGIHGELLGEQGLHEHPVGFVVAEAAVNEHEGRAGAVLVVANGYAGR